MSGPDWLAFMMASMQSSSSPLRYRQRGFSMLELVVVLVIMALLAGITMSSGVSVISSARLAGTNKKIDAIDQAIMNFRIANDRLPCPADLTQKQGSATYGTEGNCTAIASGVFTSNNAAGTAVAAAEGGLPTVALGLPNDFMYDGWGNHFRYAVDVTMTTMGSFSGAPVGSLCGPITVYAGPSYPAASARTTAAVYAIISHGANLHGGVTSNGTVYNAGSNNKDELQNCHCDNTGSYAGTYGTYNATYVEESPYSYVSIGAANHTYDFDDIVSFKERWQMQASRDVAGTSCPAVYVADGTNNRIKKVDFSGNYLAQYTLANLTNPNDVKVDSSGNLWVADYGYNSVWELSSGGAFIAGIGAGYDNVSGTKGTTGTSTGQFNAPTGVALDNQGNIWVVDSSNNRVQEFDANLFWLSSIPSSGTTSGWATGSFKGARGIFIDANNNIWVADGGNNRIQEFNTSGTFIQAIGGGVSPYSTTTCGGTGGNPPACPATPIASGAMSNPRSVAIDGAGNIWVADSGNNRVVKFSNTGTYLGAFTNSFSNPTAVWVDSTGYVWVSDTSNSKIDKCTPASTISSTTCTAWGSNGNGNSQYSGAVGIFAVGGSR